MKIEKQQENEKMTVKVSGRLDTTTSPELEQELINSIDGIKELILDFGDLDYISSAGLRVVLAVQKIMNTQGAMKVVNVSETIMEIFDITGFTEILTIEQ